VGGDVYVKKSTLLYEGSAGLDDLLDVGIQCARIGRLQAQEAGVPYIDMARRLGAVSGSV